MAVKRRRTVEDRYANTHMRAQAQRFIAYNAWAIRHMDLFLLSARSSLLEADRMKLLKTHHSANSQAGHG
jgi:hypothetical protein